MMYQPAKNQYAFNLGFYIFVFMNKVIAWMIFFSGFYSCMPDSPENEKIVDADELAREMEGTPDSLETEAFLLYDIIPQSSQVFWKGERITGDFHTGSVDIKRGNIKVKDGVITGGNFVLDMNSMKELNPESEETTIVVMGYLQSERFFNTQKYPEAVLNIIGESGNNLVGNLKIKETSRAVALPFKKQISGDTLLATANFKIDRTNWGIDFRSAKSYKDLGTLAIKDSIGFNTRILAIQHK